MPHPFRGPRRLGEDLPAPHTRACRALPDGSPVAHRFQGERRHRSWMRNHQAPPPNELRVW